MLFRSTGQPYQVHLRAVVGLVSAVTSDDNLIAAAWLHDIVEDTPVTFEDVEGEFGTEIAALVRELTDVSQPGDGNRMARKALDRRHLAAASPGAQTIKLADIIDNTQDICRHDPKFSRVYLGEIWPLLDVLGKGDPELYARARQDVVRQAARLGISLPEPAASEVPSENVAATVEAMTGMSGHHGIRLFTEAFSARDILEPLPSYDRQHLDVLCRDAVTRPQGRVFGVRDQGLVNAYCLSGDWSEQGLLRSPRLMEPAQILNIEAAFDSVVHVLTLYSHCFVAVQRSVIGVIGREHMEKPVVRMWLFGIIILIEMLTVSQIRRLWPQESWRQ